MNAAHLVREARTQRGLSQSQLARRASTTQTYISRVERGAVEPSLSTLERLLHATGHHLSTKLEPLDPGNVPLHILQASLRDQTPAERVEESIELSRFLTDVAAKAARQ